jgi:hypothetical protein
MQQHPHDHGAHAEVKDRRDMTQHEKRAGAILSLLVEKDVVSTEEIWRAIDDGLPVSGPWGQGSGEGLG